MADGESIAIRNRHHHGRRPAAFNGEWASGALKDCSLKVSGCPSPNPAYAFRYAPGSPSMLTRSEDRDPNPANNARRGWRPAAREPYHRRASAAPFGAAYAGRTARRVYPSWCRGAARDRPFSLSAIARSAERAGALLPDRAGSSAAIGQVRRGSSAHPSWSCPPWSSCC